MDNAEKKLELILAYLLGKPGTTTDDLENNLEQLAADPEVQALLERVEAAFSQQDDPDWLEAIAAAGEGAMTPYMLDFLQDRDILSESEPDLVAQFETLSAAFPADESPLLPGFPTFAEQFQKKTSSSESGLGESRVWQQGAGFEWQHLEDKGQVIIRLVADVLSAAARKLADQLQSPAGQLAPILRAGESSQTLFQLELKERIENLEVTVTAEEDLIDPSRCTVTVTVNYPNQVDSFDLDNTEITLKRGDHKLDTQVTDALGEATFEQINKADLSQLVIEITPSLSEANQETDWPKDIN